MPVLRHTLTLTLTLTLTMLLLKWLFSDGVHVARLCGPENLNDLEMPPRRVTRSVVQKIPSTKPRQVRTPGSTNDQDSQEQVSKSTDEYIQ